MHMQAIGYLASQQHDLHDKNSEVCINTRQLTGSLAAIHRQQQL